MQIIWKGRQTEISVVPVKWLTAEWFPCTMQSVLFLCHFLNEKLQRDLQRASQMLKGIRMHKVNLKGGDSLTWMMRKRMIRERYSLTLTN